MTASIPFDRAAEYYDETRALPSDVHDAFIDVAAAELAGRGTCVEVGAGTGRIARSLDQRGIDMVGSDLSEPMLRRLVTNAGGQLPFPLVRADATRLPFVDGSFAAALVCHVLHLIPRWRDAVADLARVVRAGGVLVISMGGPPGSLARAVAVHFEEEVGRGPLRPGLTELADLDDALAGVAVRRDLEAVPQRIERSLTQLIAGYERNQFGITWDLPDDVRLRAIEGTKQWAEATYGSLDHTESDVIELIWRAYDL